MGKNRSEISRREFIRRAGTLSGVAFASLAGGGVLLSACTDGGAGGTTLTTLAGATSTTASPGTTSATLSLLDRAREQGYLRVGFNNSNPWGFIGDEGQLTGQGPEVVREVLGELGVPEIDGVITDFAALIPGLQAGRFDMVAGPMAINPERCEQVLFSNPHSCNAVAFIVQSGNPLNITTYDDVLDNPEIRLGTAEGGVEQQWATDLGVPEGQLVVLPGDIPTILDALAGNRIDAIVLTATQARNAVATSEGSLDMSETFVPVINGEPQNLCQGFAFRKENEELRDAFNEELAVIAESGRLLELEAQFGFTPAEVESAFEVDLEDLCST